MIRLETKQLEYNDLLAFQLKNGVLTNLSEERYNWLYINNINGKAIFYCAYDESKLIGIEVHIPLLFTQGNNKFMTSVAVNSLVDDEYRGKGIWRKLLVYSQEEAKKAGIKIIWGVPNKDSYPILLKKTNWRIVSSSSFEMFFLRAPGKSDIYPSVIHYLFSIWPRLYFPSKNKFSFSEKIFDTDRFVQNDVKITSGLDYLKWRYQECPSEDFRIFSVDDFSGENCSGYVVVSIIDCVLFVADYCLEEKYHDYLPEIVYTLGRKLNCRKVNIRVNLNDTCYRRFKKAGSISRNSYSIFANIIDDETGNFVSMKNWILNFGDEDIRFIKSFRDSISGNYSRIKKLLMVDP